MLKSILIENEILFYQLFDKALYFEIKGNYRLAGKYLDQAIRTENYINYLRRKESNHG